MKTILLITLAATFSLLSPETASACTCRVEPRPLIDAEVRAGIAKELAESVAVFSGEVIQIDRYEVKFKIAKMWKGDPAKEVTMSTGTVKIDETHYRSSSCDYRFKTGEKYLVYARRFEAGLVAYKCTGTKLLAQAERDMSELDNLNPDAYQPPVPSAAMRRRNLTDASTRPPSTLPLLHVEWWRG